MCAFARVIIICNLQKNIKARKTAHTGTAYASPPYGGSGFRLARSFRCASFPRQPSPPILAGNGSWGDTVHLLPHKREWILPDSLPRAGFFARKIQWKKLWKKSTGNRPYEGLGRGKCCCGLTQTASCFIMRMGVLYVCV
jgi:hypothetical protein